MFKNSVLLSGVLALACSGCSFIFVHPPHFTEGRLAEAPSDHCTSSKVAPVIDAVVTGLEGVRTGIALSADDSTYQNSPISRNADIGLGVGFAALFLASSIYGFYETGQCHATTPPIRTPDDADPVPQPSAPLDRHATRPAPPPPRRRSPEEP